MKRKRNKPKAAPRGDIKVAGAYALGMTKTPEWAYAEIKSGMIVLAVDKLQCAVVTPRGVETCNRGDFVVKGKDGNLYVVPANMIK